VSAGTLRLGDDDVIPDSSTVIVNGTLDLNGSSETIGGLSGSGVVDTNKNAQDKPTLTVSYGNANEPSVFAGVIKNSRGTLALTKTGTGTLTLSGPNTYGGDTTVSEGTLQLGKAGVIPDTSKVIVNGTLDLNGNNEMIGGLSGAGTGIVDTTGGNSTLTIMVVDVNGNPLPPFMG